MDLAHSDYLQRAFTSLLGELGHLWPKQDVDYVSDEVGHGEYGDALENLIAIGCGTAKDLARPNYNKSKPWPQPWG